MKAYKLKFGTYDNENEWDQVFVNYKDVVEAYRKERKKYEGDNSFREYEPDKYFSVDGINCEWYEIDVEGNDKPLVYLASPYTGNEEENFKTVSKKAAELMNEGMIIFSPIAMAHPMAVYGKLPGGWEFWEKFDRSYLSVCNKVIVYRLPGWETSKGVQSEIKIADELNIPIEYID